MAKRIVIGLALVASLSACNSEQISQSEHQLNEQTFVAHLHPTTNNAGKQGYILFQQGVNGVAVRGHLEGLPANSTHGFHVHEYGDCSAPDATSAGSHFNPTGMSHGAPEHTERHMGDLGNVHTNNEGLVDFELVDNQLAMTGAHSILGRAVVIHAQPDDLTSQPVGNAGARILCGVIGVAKAP